MSAFLGIDTSNYTTSVALYYPEENRIKQVKKLLPVKEGSKGLRQSDAVFHHTKQLPQIMTELFSEETTEILDIGVSVKPRWIEGSYMPCFLCGEGLAESLSAVHNKKIWKTSHQVGHILAALYGANAFSLLEHPFLAFHVSGGTTDAVLCTPNSDTLIETTPLATSLDLHAGQAIDRVGILLGLSFPCGPQLEKLAAQSHKKYKHSIKLKDYNCCLSGIENQCKKMSESQEPKEDIALYCQSFLAQTLCAMTENLLKLYPKTPILYAGGVMSNQYIQTILKENFSSKTDIFVAPPEFSSDNAAGTALYAYFKNKQEHCL